MSASPNPAIANGPVTFTVTLRGTRLDLVGVVWGKQVSVSAWGASNQCTTGSDGTCKVTLKAPSSAGSYQVTAQFAGDTYFLPSTGSIRVVVVSTAKVNVNLQLVAYKVVNVQVAILQGSTVVATQARTLTPGSPSAFVSFVLNGGTYKVRVSGYSLATQTKTVTIPPDATVSFYIS